MVKEEDREAVKVVAKEVVKVEGVVEVAAKEEEVV